MTVLNPSQDIVLENYLQTHLAGTGSGYWIVSADRRSAYWVGDPAARPASFTIPGDLPNDGQPAIITDPPPDLSAVFQAAWRQLGYPK